MKKTKKKDKKKTYITDLHFDHVVWNSELTFQKEELRIFRDRLEEVAPRYTAIEVKSQVEHFQNVFIRHNEVIDTLLHHFKVHEQKLVAYAEAHPVAIDHVHFDDHKGLRDQVKTQRKIYKDLKKEFMKFLSKTM